MHVHRAPRYAILGVLLAACSVPDKQRPDAGDAGVDAPGDTTAPDTTIDQGPAAFSNSGTRAPFT